MKRVNLSNAIRRRTSPGSISYWIDIGNKVLKTTNREELSAIVFNRADLINLMIDKKQYERIENFEILKNRIIVFIIGSQIAELIHKEKSVRGPKGDRLNELFEQLNTEPLDVWQIADDYGLSINTIKNHRRYDTCPEKGLTKIKDWKIFRLPIDE